MKGIYNQKFAKADKRCRVETNSSHYNNLGNTSVFKNTSFRNGKAFTK